MLKKAHQRNTIGLFGWPKKAAPFDRALLEGRYAQQRQHEAVAGVWLSLSSHYPEVAAQLRARGWSDAQSVAWLLSSAPDAEVSVGELLLEGRLNLAGD